jgi:hypothetical protein
MYNFNLACFLRWLSSTSTVAVDIFTLTFAHSLTSVLLYFQQSTVQNVSLDIWKIMIVDTT